jgi:hypothetical protein
MPGVISEYWREQPACASSGLSIRSARRASSGRQPRAAPSGSEPSEESPITFRWRRIARLLAHERSDSVGPRGTGFICKARGFSLRLVAETHS